MFLLLVILILATPCFAQTCTPPSASHPTLQQAIDDPGCAIVSLQAQAYEGAILISRSVNLLGAGMNSSMVNGPITISGLTTLVNLSEVGVRDGCTAPGIKITEGAQASILNVAIRAVAVTCSELPDELFEDGFEGI